MKKTSIPHELLTTYAAWDEYVSDIWFSLLNHLDINRSGTIVEIAPGRSIKIALALGKLNFAGTLFLVEPLHSLHPFLLTAYGKILPHATLHIIGKPLYSCVSALPSPIDALISHSPLDDMLMAGLCKNQKFLEKLFNWTCKDELKVQKYFQNTWKRIYKNKKQYLKRTRFVLSQWEKAIEAIKPKSFLISQYPSLVLREQGLDALNLSAQKILYKIQNRFTTQLVSDACVQKILDKKEHYDFDMIKNEVLQACNWCVYSNTILILNS